MILAIDVGNTNIVIACIDREKIYFTARLETDQSKTKDEYLIRFKDILNFYKIDVTLIAGAIISSVVPQLIPVHKEAITEIVGKTPLVVDPSMKTGLNIAIDSPGEIGSDLIVGAVAAIEDYACPVIIFDFGTATTVSVIDCDKNFIGGLIMPGLKISLEALVGSTAQLPYVALDAPAEIIAKNTVDCMKSGLIYGNAAMIDGLIARIQENLATEATVIATGGLASTILPFCKKKIIYDDDLLLRGLLYLYEKNSHSNWI